MKPPVWRSEPLLTLKDTSDEPWTMEFRQANLNACGMFFFAPGGGDDLVHVWYMDRKDAKRLAKALRKWAKK